MRPVDRFLLFNLVLFLLMAGTVYYDRFVQFRGTGNLSEFFFYALFIIGVILIVWRGFRNLDFPNSVLVLVEVGILMHFAGGLVFIDDHRLYDHIIIGIRYDKFVHFVNAYAAATMTEVIFSQKRLRLTNLQPLVILLVVLGLGAIIEILEYLVTLTVRVNGVGDYNNNMQDLIGNLMGGVFYIFWQYADRRR